MGQGSTTDHAESLVEPAPEESVVEALMQQANPVEFVSADEESTDPDGR